MKPFQEKDSWIFKDFKPFSDCVAKITAVTKGGKSAPSSRIMMVPDNVQQVADNPQNLWIWIVCLVSVVKLLGLVILFRRKIRTDVIGICFDKEVLDACVS